MPDPQGQSALATPEVTITTPEITPVPESNTPSWFDALPEGLKANPTLQNFRTKDITAVAESLVESQKMIGGSIRLPGEKDLPADRQAKLDKIYTQLGRPTTPEGYTLQAPAAESGVPWDAAQAEQFKSVAHKLGLTQAQVEGLAAYDTQRAMGSQVDSTQAYNTCIETLQQEWGPASKQMLGLARRTASAHFDPETLAALDAAGVSNNPQFVKALASIGKSLMEEGLIVGGREGMGEDGGINSLQGEYEKTMADGKSAYWNKQDPGHDAAVQRMHSLQKALLDLSATSTPR
jgi:hypothetical protein